jgi:glycosyltransferase involved in cell wall biosynthesis
MVTVLLATYNGAETLPKALNAYCQLQAPTAGWKLVVVDNGSTDGLPLTLEVVVRSNQTVRKDPPSRWRLAQVRHGSDEFVDFWC